MCVCVCVCVCVRAHASVAMKNVPDEWQALQVTPGDTSSKQHANKKYNKIKRPVSSVDHCHPYRRKKKSSY